MYPRVVSFCLLIEFYENLKAKYEVHFGMNEEVKFEKTKTSVVGEISCWQDGFPLKYEVPSSLKHLHTEQMRICDILIHNGLASAIPRMLTAGEHSHIHFTHTFPSYISPELVLQVSQYVFLHSCSPGNLRIGETKQLNLV